MKTDDAVKQTIVIEGISTLVRDETRVEHDVDILIVGSRIEKIGRVTPQEIGQEAIVINGRGRIVIPGLVNAHTHLYQSMLKGRRDDLSLVSWCEDVTFPFVRKVLNRLKRDRNDEIGYLWSILGTTEMIRNGITSFVDSADTGKYPRTYRRLASNPARGSVSTGLPRAVRPVYMQ
jgi:5-methylthioadenosine/S-adenosylhomocysteine deaminase